MLKSGRHTRVNLAVEALATAEDQAWFWTEEWQAGEREAEADLAAGRYQVFDKMEDLIDDLGWPR
jgi:hypothetical protein